MSKVRFLGARAVSFCVGVVVSLAAASGESVAGGTDDEVIRLASMS
ncbi:hypothetical protein [Ralstonia solanacearum]|nr:hypothetical protein [Ralstonia solanacearum]